MTIFTLHGSVRSQQRKAVLVIPHLLHGNIPSLHRVAIRTVSAHFSLVNIRVAVLAILPHIRKNRFHMALRALHLFVHAPQRILGFVVIELGNGLDGSPGRSRVAVFARNRQRPVRTSSGSALTLRKASTACWQRNHQHPEHEFEVSRRIRPPRALLLGASRQESPISEIVMHP